MTGGRESRPPSEAYLTWNWTLWLTPPVLKATVKATPAAHYGRRRTIQFVGDAVRIQNNS